jgi:hypothetical protein
MFLTVYPAQNLSLLFKSCIPVPVPVLRIRITLMQIRIQFFTKMRICNHWPTDPQGLHSEPPRLHFESLKLRIFHSKMDPDPAFHSNADPDPASFVNANPGSWR